MTSCSVNKVTRDLESIDHLFINPIRRIGLMHKWSLDSRNLKWIVQVNVLLINCKQTFSSLSLLVGTTVAGNERRCFAHKHTNTLDLFSAIVKSIKYFVEKMKASFQCLKIHCSSTTQLLFAGSQFVGTTK